MRISLIVPTYNRLENTRTFIERIIHSHQDELHEIVFSDDGSTEDQFEVLRCYADALRVSCILVRQEDLGFRLARTRNNGVRHCTGDYLCFLDQDLIPSPGYFKEIKLFARRNRFLITRTLYTTPEEKDEILSSPGDDILKRLRHKGREYLRKVVVKDYFYYLGKKIGIGDRRPKLKGGAFSLFRDSFERVDGFDEDFVGWGLEDDDLGRRLYLTGIAGFNISHRACTYHLWHEETGSKNHRPNRERWKQKTYDRAHLRPENGLSRDTGEKIEVVRIK